MTRGTRYIPVVMLLAGCDLLSYETKQAEQGWDLLLDKESKREFYLDLEEVAQENRASFRSTGDGAFAGYSVTIRKGCTEFIAATAPFGPETGIARYRHSQDEECDDQELISSVVDVIEKYDGVEE